MAALVVVGLAPPVLALPYTIAGPVVIDASNDAGSGVRGTLLPVTDLSGTSICLAGTCDALTQDWLLVALVLDSGSAAVDRIVPGAVGESAVGAGYLGGSGETPTGGSLFYGDARIEFGYPDIDPTNLEEGETSARLFAAYAAGDLPGDGLPFAGIDPGTANIRISSLADFDIEAAIVPVPEPGTLLLLGSALLWGVRRGLRRG